MTTAYITHPDCLRHEMGAEHPERPQRLEEKWFPALESFKPQLILISAGFDAHRDDLLGGLGSLRTITSG
jgi:acetoin utilization deacetylase AcuC-like enzyme